MAKPRRKIGHGKRTRKSLPRSCNMNNARVLLTRLSAEEIARHTTDIPNQNEIEIKEEPVEEPVEELVMQGPVEHPLLVEFRQFQLANQQVETTVQRVETVVKIEPSEVVNVKTEPIDTYENTVVNTTFTNFYGEFKCKVCFKMFDNYEEHIVHKNLAHRDQPKYSCQFCNEKFGLSAHLNNHLLIHVKHFGMTNPLALPPVTQSSSTSDLTVIQKANYIRKVTTVEPQCTIQSNHFKCPNCNFMTDTELKLSRHKNSCSEKQQRNSIKTIKCDFCSKLFVNQSSLNGHMRYHSLRGEMVSKNTLRQKGVNIKPVEKSAVKSKPKNKTKFVCKICDKQFVSIVRLNKHMLLHKSVKSNTKQVSNGKLQNRKNVLKTVNVKSGFPKITSTGKKLKQNSKTFQCQHCENFYSSKRSLSDHTKRFHTYTACIDITPPLLEHYNKTPTVKCNYCDTFITKCNLKRHVRSLHPNII